MILLGLLYLIVAAVAGTTSVVVLWPLFAVAVALLYVADRPQRRPVRTVFAVLGLAAGAVYKIGSWHASLGPPGLYLWFLAPLVLAGLIVLAAGGPKRIRARHERREQLRRQRRAELTAASRAARAERGAARRTARRETILRKTGVDVDVVTDVAAEKGRTAGAWITRRLQRNRPARPPAGPPDLLDLDQDVAADLSRRRSEEILRLAGELDKTRRPRPRPH